VLDVLAGEFLEVEAAPVSLVTNLGGVMFAVAIMWPTTSRTVQPAHSEGLSQSASGSTARALTSDARSSLIICQVSMVSPLQSPLQV
jgi:hypothetical protein